MSTHIALVLSTDDDNTDDALRTAKEFAEGLNSDGESPSVSVLGPLTQTPNGFAGGNTPPPTMDDLIAAVQAFIPGATLGEDNDGQLVIYTDAQVDDDGSTIHYEVGFGDSDDDDSDAVPHLRDGLTVNDGKDD